MNDLRYALRSLKRQPGFTAVAVLTLALGIGANTAVFSVVRAVLLRPLPYGDPGGVVMVWNRWTGWPRTWLSEPEFADYRGATDVFEHLGAYVSGATNLTGEGEPERLPTGFVSAEVFPALRVQFVLGRGFVTEEDRPNGPRAVVLTHEMWSRRFGRSPSVLGRALVLNGNPYEVVGILPPGVRLPTDFAGNQAQLYVPLALGTPDENNRGSHYLLAVGRLRTGVELEQAQVAMGTMVRRMVGDHPGSYDGSFGVALVPAAEQVLGTVRRALLVVTGAVAFVLLLACVNVASLLLTRAEAKHRELAVRRALGAGTGPLARYVFAESLVLSLAGTAAGLLLAAWSLSLLPRLRPASLPRVDDVALNLPVLAFSVLACVVTALLCTALPLWRITRGELYASLKEGTRASAGGARQRLRRTLIGIELGTAVVLCVGAGLLLKSFLRLSRVAPGFESKGVLTLRTSLPGAPYAKDSQVRQFYEELLPRVRALPGVEAAGAVYALPLTTTIGDWTFAIEGRPPGRPGEAAPVADWLVATPGYFEAMGIRLRAGRSFTEADRLGTSGVVIINQATANRYWPEASPLGARMRLGGVDSLWRTVIGVVENVRQSDLAAEPRAQFYLPHAQFPTTVPDNGSGAIRGMTLTIRTAGSPTALVAAIRATLRDRDPNLPVTQVRTMDEVVRQATATPRFAVALVGMFAMLALLIAGVGVYGIVAYVVSLRTTEIGLRVALGARPRDVLGLVVGQGMVPGALGVAGGLATAFALRRALATMLYQVSSADALVFGATAAVLLAVGLAATVVPARRASRVDPLVALRYE